MVGLETFYVKGKEGISEQIKTKSQIFLGDIAENKKRLTKLYEFRSSLIHGTKNFPGYFHIHDGDETYEKFAIELCEVLNTAQSILFATIQKMAKNNMRDLDFRYTLC